MKKLIALIVVCLLLTTAAYAECTIVYLPQSATMTLTSTSITLTGDAPIILTENHKLPGIKTLSEVVYVLPYNSFDGYTYIDGIVDNQFIREIGLQVVYECGNGFSLLPDVIIEIFNEYVNEVRDIISERVGTNELSLNSFLAAALWRIDNRAGYIFYDSYSSHVQIGKMITKWGWVPIYKGDINEDGYYEIGFPPFINVINTNNTTTIVDYNTTINTNTTTGCSNTVTNVNVTGNGNITTTTAATTIVKGDNNNTTVVNNNSNTNMYALIGIVINNDSNNTVVNTNSGEQEICKPSLFVDKTQRNPNSGCG